MEDDQRRPHLGAGLRFAADRVDWRGDRRAVEPVDRECTFPASELEAYLTLMGPVGRALAGQDDATRARVVDRVRPALAPFVRGDEVAFTAACWLVSATA